MSLEYPTIHLNGSCADTLYNDLKEAYQALETAIDKVRQTAPHGRDYYVKEDQDSFKNARIQYENRMNVLNTIAEDLALIANKVRKQQR